MASITFWNRLEPRPRAPSLTEPLSARVRDPLWFLTRQWQFGELQGEDAGSPAFARVAGTHVPLTGWRAGDGPISPLPASSPLEPLVEREAFTPDLSLRVELAQTFEDLLASGTLTAAQVRDVIAAFRVGAPLPAAPADDPDARRFALVVNGRSFDGVAVYRASISSPPTLPAAVALPAGTELAVSTAQAALVGWVQAVYGDVGEGDAPAWRPERLEYAASLFASPSLSLSSSPSPSPSSPSLSLSSSPSPPSPPSSSSSLEGEALELRAGSSPDGTFEWHAFTLTGATVPGRGLDRRPPVTKPWSIIPTPVRFRGMPNARWWDFESGTTDFGDIRPDRRDLARLVVMDFMLVHGNDWFVIPYDMPVGHLGRIDSLVVRDVFGGDTLVERADRDPQPPLARWSLFEISAPAASTGFGDFLLLSPTASEVMLHGAPLEDVRFLKDDLANLAWAIEETIEGGAGGPRSGHERSVALLPAPPPPPEHLTYRIQTEVPANWIPFVPSTVDATTGAIALERAGMPAPGGGLIEPAGRILKPSSLAGQPYQLHEEEVSRAGTRITRVVCRARWTDGSTHLWIARRKSAAQGEASSGLVFDGTEGG